MSSIPAAEVHPAISPRVAALSPPLAATLAAVLATLGLFTIWPTAQYLWVLWTTDALKSIGMFIPVVSFVLILRAWHTLDWEMEVSWFGLLILAVTIVAVHLREQSVLVLILSPRWSIFIPPHSLVVFAYVSGIVLLFGGTRLYRAALFPIILVWFANPVPHVFNVLVDLPLQRISAHVARTFAIALGQPLSPDQMRLMFTPNFGMFIAPGCNGIRGAVTMGFISLIAGYLYRFRWYAHAAVVIAAVLLGYVFNFVRLCALVLYYIVALHFPKLQPHAEMGDYIIGACLFLIATGLLFFVINRLSESPDQTRPEAPAPVLQPSSTTNAAFIYTRLAIMLFLVTLGGSDLAHAVLRARAAAAIADKSDPRALGQFPEHLGTYTLARSWNENLITGPLIYHWADYAPPDGGTHVLIGISPLLGSHDTLICHSARGEDPSWHSQLDFTTVDNPRTSFSASFFSEGATQYLEATTICTGASCGEYSSAGTSFGLVYSRPLSPASVFSQDPSRPIPILVRAETVDATFPPDYARQQMTIAIRTFLASANLASLTQPYRRS